jgi:uncharacterized BrkB/YihY/UPF0761 family membrane protein
LCAKKGGSSVVAGAISANYIPSIVGTYGSGFPETIVKALPAFTTLFLGFLPFLRTTIYAGISMSIVGAALVQFRGATPQSKAHSLSLITLAMYHLLLMLWVGFVIAFFWLPKAKAAI